RLPKSEPESDPWGRCRHWRRLPSGVPAEALRKPPALAFQRHRRCAWHCPATRRGGPVRRERKSAASEVLAPAASRFLRPAELSPGRRCLPLASAATELQNRPALPSPHRSSAFPRLAVLVAASQLEGDEPVIRHIRIECVNDPVAVSPHVADGSVAFEAAGLAVAHEIEPVAAPALAVARVGQQLVH